ncbi:hypothetical protein HT031_006903 [Scenedesmus sp. PABB004]|nr:hypothetical protein HT031_006903 [Scenedesmus sp. PABB004]
MQPRYESLPAAAPWAAPRDAARRRLVTIGGVTVPAVPLACAGLFLVGLPLWAGGMLAARSTTVAAMGDLGVTAEGVDRLKASVLAAVLVLSPAAACVLGANLWLEAGRPAAPARAAAAAVSDADAAAPPPPGPARGPPRQQARRPHPRDRRRRRRCRAAATGLSLSNWVTTAAKVNVANWVLLLALATVALGGSITWLTMMSGALSAARGAGGGGSGPAPPWFPPAAPALAPAPAPAPAAAAAAVAAPAQAGLGAGGVTPCPPGCADLGLIAAVLGLPWNCLCGGAFLLGDLTAQLETLVRQLYVALAGALALFVATSWLFGHLSAAGAHAERDLAELVPGAGPGAVGGVA